MKKDRSKTQRFYSFYHHLVCLFILTGLIASVYLGISHYRIHTDIAYSSFCAISRTYNCDTVSQSPYSIFLGVPLPLWGVLGYGFLFVLLLLKLDTPPVGRHLWMSVFLISFAFSVYSLFLAWVSTFTIESYCAVCMVTYAVNFLVVFTAWMSNRLFSDLRFPDSLRTELSFLKSRWKRVICTIFPFAVIAAVMMFFFPNYWERPHEDLLTGVPRGVTMDGHPWIGAENPSLVITEFTDYQCYQCNKMHYYLRKMIRDYPGAIRLVHRNFPMDHEVNPLVREPYHIGSGALARIAIHAKSRGKFWEVSDTLYFIARKAFLENRQDAFAVSEIAQRIKMDSDEVAAALTDREYFRQMNRDILDGIRLGVTGTPVYVIDGKIHPEIPPWDELQKVIENSRATKTRHTADSAIDTAETTLGRGKTPKERR